MIDCSRGHQRYPQWARNLPAYLEEHAVLMGCDKLFTWPTEVTSVCRGVECRTDSGGARGGMDTKPRELTLRNMPSPSFMILALCTAVTFLRLFSSANSNAYSAVRKDLSYVITWGGGGAAAGEEGGWE